MIRERKWCCGDVIVMPVELGRCSNDTHCVIMMNICGFTPSLLVRRLFALQMYVGR